MPPTLRGSRAAAATDPPVHSGDTGPSPPSAPSARSGGPSADWCARGYAVGSACRRRPTDTTPPTYAEQVHRQPQDHAPRTPAWRGCRTTVDQAVRGHDRDGRKPSCREIPPIGRCGRSTFVRSRGRDSNPRHPAWPTSISTRHTGAGAWARSRTGYFECRQGA